MKKIKLFAPMLAAIGTISVVAPVVTLVSCNNSSNINKVVLQQGQKQDRTVASDTSYVGYYLKQENISYPEETTVTIKDFKVNNVSIDKPRDYMFTFNSDSAGNMRLNVKVGDIITSWSYVDTISFSAVFTNTKANTSHEVGPFTITISDEEDSSCIVHDTSSPTNPFYYVVSHAIPGITVLKVTTKEDYMPEKFSAKYHLSAEANDVVDLTEGFHYAYYVDANDTKRGYLIFNNYIFNNYAGKTDTAYWEFDSSPETTQQKYKTNVFDMDDNFNSGVIYTDTSTDTIEFNTEDFGTPGKVDWSFYIWTYTNDGSTGVVSRIIPADQTQTTFAYLQQNFANLNTNYLWNTNYDADRSCIFMTYSIYTDTSGDVAYKGSSLIKANKQNAKQSEAQTPDSKYK